ncbi:hypothetical protein QFC20_000442 [Naganishia adeliensis]|uniref:Uncharacterized protein n=1 Tax=Naganishia adeliensis TaxID=92952 RepID=A0ACC2WZU0_9TREE|nr:hypothetical protein QFC20_000442 [Naganishia adeliensis]
MSTSVEVSDAASPTSAESDTVIHLYKEVNQEEINESLETFWSGLRFIAWSNSSTKAQDVKELWEELVEGLQGLFGEHGVRWTSESFELVEAHKTRCQSLEFKRLSDEPQDKGMTMSTLFEVAKCRKFIPPTSEWETSGIERNLTIQRLLQDLKKETSHGNET